MTGYIGRKKKRLAEDPVAQADFDIQFQNEHVFIPASRTNLQCGFRALRASWQAAHLPTPPQITDLEDVQAGEEMQAREAALEPEVRRNTNDYYIEIPAYQFS